MSSISPGFDHAARTAAVIGTEEEAVGVAGTLAALFDDAVPGDEAALERLARSGLFGISIPTEYGGIDVPNAVLAEVCAVAAAGSAALGDILAAHFVALETLRSHGTEGQRAVVFPAVLAGARLSRAAAFRRGGDGDEAMALAASGLHWRIGGEALATPCTRHADWIVLPACLETGRTGGVLLPAHAGGLHYVANGLEPAAAEHVLFRDVTVENDALMAPALSRTEVFRALDLLLEAARALGAGRRRLAELLDAAEENAVATGLASARLSAASAMVAEAGRAVDAAQLGLAAHHRTNAFHAAVAALSAARESAGLPEVPEALLVESGEMLREAHRQPPEEAQ